MRAQLLSRAANHRELVALTSAWLGHIHFNEGNIPAAVQSISLASDTIEPHHWAALARLSSVLGDMFLTISEPIIAKLWYSHARHAAVQYGDQAAIGGIAYNQAAFRLFDVRVKAALGLPVDVAALQLASAESQSAINYQKVVGVTSLDHLRTSVRAGVEMVEQRFASAWELLSPLLRKAEIPPSYSFRFVILADAVLCCAHLGLETEARKLLGEMSPAIVESLPVDDRIIVCTNLNQAFAIAPQIFEGGHREVDVAELGARLLQQRSQWRQELGKFIEIPQSLRW